MANPYTPGTEAYKLFQYALNKGNNDTAAAIYTDTHIGRGLHDLSGGVAVPKTNLPVSSAAAHSSR
jgi:hypothetical protein